MMWFNTDTFAVALNVAVTLVFAVTVMLHVLVPLHAPDHPPNCELVPALAVSVTAVPLGNVPLHVCPQLIPAGLLVTLPLPPPAFVTVIWYELVPPPEPEPLPDPGLFFDV